MTQPRSRSVAVALALIASCRSPGPWRYLPPPAPPASTAPAIAPSFATQAWPAARITQAQLLLTIDDRPIAPRSLAHETARHGPAVATELRAAYDRPPPRDEGAPVVVTLHLPGGGDLRRLASDAAPDALAVTSTEDDVDGAGGSTTTAIVDDDAARPPLMLTAAWVELDTGGAPSAASDGAQFVAWVRAPGEARPDPLAAVTVLVDTSRPDASAVTSPASATEALLTALAARRPQAEVRVVAFDDAPREVAAGAAAQVAPRVRAALAAHGELGASDLAAALAFAAGADRVLVVGDAVATAGTRDPIETAHAAGIGRIDVVVPPRARSRRDAAALADAGARPGRVLHAQAVGAMDGLDVSATGRLGLTVTDAVAVWPSAITSVAPGTPVAFSGDHRGGDLTVRIGDGPVVTLQPVPAPTPLVAPLATRIERDARAAALGPPACDPAGWAAWRRRASDDAGLAIVDQRVVTAPASNLPTALERPDDAIGVPFDDGSVTWAVVGHAHGCPSWDSLATRRRDDHPAAACWPPSSDRAPTPLPAPLFGVLADVAAGRTAAALATARAAYLAQPDSAIAIIALGEAYEAAGATALAARAYASLIDQPAAGAAWWRVTAQRLDRLGASARRQAIAAYRAALARAPDHVGARRRLAIDLLRTGDPVAAIAELRVALDLAATDHARALIRDDLAIALAAAVARAPSDATIALVVATTGVRPATTPSRRVVLDLEATPAQSMASSWLVAGTAPHTAADLAIGGGPSAHATSAAPRALAAPDATAPVWLTVDACGFAGVCAGSAQLVAHDGRGGLVIEDRPFVLSGEAGRVDLGRAGPSPTR
jgi:hypothetical protein